MKYHIFIGSGLDDLKKERQELPRIIMELGHIPVMADCLETTGDASAPGIKQPGPLVQKLIEECDYFIALTAHRYAAADEKTSALEAEHAFAVKRGVPVIALVIDDKARWKASKKEEEPELIKKQEDFKKKLRTGLYGDWNGTAELCQKCQSLIIQAMNLYPRPGWVKATQAITPSVANELARLSSENEQLKRQVKIDGGEIVTKLREQLKHALKVLTLNKITLSFYYADGDNWENTRHFRALHIFKLLTPELAIGKTTAEISRFLGTVLNPDLDKTVRKDYPTPSNTIKKIMADFALLKLVRCTNQGKVNSENEIWEATEYGRELYSAYRMHQMEKGMEKDFDKP